MVSSLTSLPSSSNMWAAYSSAFRFRCSMPAWRGGVSSSGKGRILSSSSAGALGRFSGFFFFSGPGGGGGGSSGGASSPSSGSSGSSGSSSAPSPSSGRRAPGKGTTFWGGGTCLASGQGRSGPSSAGGRGLVPPPNSARISSRENSPLFSSSSLSFAMTDFLCLGGWGRHRPSRCRTAS